MSAPSSQESAEKKIYESLNISWFLHIFYFQNFLSCWSLKVIGFFCACHIKLVAKYKLCFKLPRKSLAGWEPLDAGPDNTTFFPKLNFRIFWFRRNYLPAVWLSCFFESSIMEMKSNTQCTEQQCAMVLAELLLYIANCCHRMVSRQSVCQPLTAWGCIFTMSWINVSFWIVP